MIYLNDRPENLNLEEALRLLPPHRLENTLRLRHEIDRRISAAAYLLLREGLELEYGIREIPDFGYGPDGKPFLPGLGGIHFNLSHCRRGAVCAVSDREIGIDIEEIKPHDEDLMRHVLSPEEYDHVKEAVWPEAEFIRLWTLKESYLKFTGEGLRDDLRYLLPPRRVRFDTTVSAAGGYIFTVCRADIP